MHLKEFLEKVLAKEDNYVLWLLRKGNKKGTWNENHEDIDSLVHAIKAHDRDPGLSVYIALGAFTNNVGPHPKTGRNYVQRKGHQATCFRTLACDLDVDPSNPKKYSSQKEALVDLVKACKNLGLPLPMVVLSGDGIHCWWTFVETISTAIWVPLSKALRAALDTRGVKYDPSKIEDPTMVLRPIETHHKKDDSNWKEVKVLKDQPAVHVKDLALKLKPYVRQAAPKKTKTREKAQDAILASWQEGNTSVSLQDLQRCRQLQAILASHGATDAAGAPVSEPLWRASLGIAYYCEDSETAAIELSKGHPDYDEGACLEKLDGWNGTGPTVCSTFEKLCEQGCATCQFKGRIASPAQLTGGVTAIQTENQETGVIEERPLPPGYKIKGDCVYYINPRLDEETFVSPYKLWVESRVTDMDRSTNEAKIIVAFPIEGEKEISIDSAIIAAGGNDLRKELANHQVYIKEDIEPMRRYLMTYLRKLQAAAMAHNSYSHFGWQKDGTFLLGNRLIGNKQDITVHLRGAAKDFTDHLTTQGSLGAWVKATAMFNIPGMEFHNFVATLGLAAPLFAGQKLPGMLVNMHSPLSNSGVGKSLTGKFGLSAWGDPSKLMRRPGDTPLSMSKYFGTLGNQAGYIDELTTVDDDNIRKLIMSLQDGRERSRVTSSADGFREAVEWHMPIISSSNKDLNELTTQLSIANAEQLRVLQLTFPRIPQLNEGGSRIGKYFDEIILDNFGHAGPKFISEVIARGGPVAVYIKGSNEFDKVFDFLFLGEERFYEAAVKIVYCGGKILKDLGLIKYDYLKGIKAVLQEVLARRKIRDETKLDGIDKLGHFLNDVQNRIVHFHEKVGGQPTVILPIPLNALARTELLVDSRKLVSAGTVFINKSEFRYWLRKRGLEFGSTISELEEMGVKVVPDIRKVLYKGVSGASSAGQTRCVSIDMMSHPRLREALVGNFANLQPAQGAQILELVRNAKET